MLLISIELLKNIYILGNLLKYRCQLSNSLQKQHHILAKITITAVVVVLVGTRDLMMKTMMMVNIHLKQIITKLNNLKNQCLHHYFQIITIKLIHNNREAISDIMMKLNKFSKKCLQVDLYQVEHQMRLKRNLDQLLLYLTKVDKLQSNKLVVVVVVVVVILNRKVATILSLQRLTMNLMINGSRTINQREVIGIEPHESHILI